MSFIQFSAWLLNQRAIFHALFLVVLALVSWTCLIPLDGPVVDISNFDKVLHFASYLMLAALFERAFPAHYRYKGIVMLVTYGAIIEFLQGQTDYRSASLADFIANTCGVLSYMLVQPWVVKLSHYTHPKAS